MNQALASIHSKDVQCLFGLQLTLNQSVFFVDEEPLGTLPPKGVILKGIASVLNFQVWHLPLRHCLIHTNGKNISFY